MKPKQIISWTILGIILIVIISLMAAFKALIIPGILVVVCLALFILNSYSKRKNMVSQQIPDDVMNDFQEAERRWTESGGQADPNTILWEIAKSKSSGRFITPRENKPIGKSELSSKSNGREDIQSKSNQRDADDQIRNSRLKTNNRKGLFGAKRRRI